MIEPTYLRYIVDRLEESVISSQNESSIPDGFIGLFEESFPASLSVTERTKILRKFGILSLIKSPVSINFISYLFLESEDETKAFIDKFSKWFNSPTPGKYIIYHDRLKLFFLQKLSNHEILEINESIISKLEISFKNSDDSEFERYAIQNLSDHMYIESQLNNNYNRFIKFANNENLWNKQIKLSNEYDWTFQTIKKSIKESALKNDDKNLLKSVNNFIKISKEEDQNFSQIIDFIKLNKISLAFSRIDKLSGDKRFKIYLLILTEIFFGELNKTVIGYENIEKIVNDLKILIDEKNNTKEVEYVEKELVDRGGEINYFFDTLDINVDDKFLKKVKVKKVKIIDWPDFFPQLIMFYITKELDLIDIDFTFIWEIDKIDFSEILNHDFQYFYENEQVLLYFFSNVLVKSNNGFEDLLHGSSEAIKLSLQKNYENLFKYSIQTALTIFEQFKKQFILKDYYFRIIQFTINTFTEEDNLLDKVNDMSISELKKLFLDEILFSTIETIEDVNTRLDWYKHLIFVSVSTSKYISNTNLDYDFKEKILDNLLKLIKKHPELIQDDNSLYELVFVLNFFDAYDHSLELYKNRDFPLNIRTRIGAFGADDYLSSPPGSTEFEQAKTNFHDISPFYFISKSLINTPSKDLANSIAKKMVLEIKKVKYSFSQFVDVVIFITEYYLKVDELEQAINLISFLKPNDRKTVYLLFADKLFKKNNGKGQEIISIENIRSLCNSDSIPTLHELNSLNQSISFLEINISVQNLFEAFLLVEDYDITNTYFFRTRQFDELTRLGFQDLVIDILEISPKNSDFSKNYPYFKLTCYLIQKKKIEASIRTLDYIPNDLFRYFSVMFLVKNLILSNKINEIKKLIDKVKTPLLNFYLNIYFFSLIYKNEKIDKNDVSVILDDIYNSVKGKSYMNLFHQISYSFLCSLDHFIDSNFCEYFQKKFSDKSFLKNIENVKLIIEKDIFMANEKVDSFSDELIDNNMTNLHYQKKIMQQMAEYKIELEELKKAESSIFYDLTETQKKRLDYLKSSEALKEITNEKEIIINQENIDDYSYKFKQMIYNDFPYYTIKLGNKILDYYYSINDDENFDFFLDSINNLIKNNDDVTVDNYNDIIKKIIKIINKNPSYEFTKILDYLEKEINDNYDEQFKVDSILLYDIYKSYSKNNFLQFIIEKDILIDKDVLEFLKKELKNNKYHKQNKQLFKQILESKFYNESLRDEFILFCLNLSYYADENEIISLIKHKNNQKKAKLIFLKKNILILIKTNDFETCLVDKKSPKLKDRIVARTKFKFWEEEVEDELTGEKTVNKKKKLIIEKGSIITEDDIELILNQKIDSLEVLNDIKTVSERGYQKLIFELVLPDEDKNLHTKNDNFLFQHIIKLISSEFLFNGYDKSKTNKILTLLREEECSNFFDIVDSLLNEDYFKESLIVCNIIKEKWGIYKYISKRRANGGIEFWNLDKDKSLKSYLLSKISKFLLMDNKFDKCIEVVNMIDDVYIKINLYKQLRLLYLENEDIDIEDKFLESLRDEEILLYQYQYDYEAKIASNSIWLFENEFKGKKFNLFHENLSDYLTIKLKQIYNKTPNTKAKNIIVKQTLDFLEKYPSVEVIQKSSNFLLDIIELDFVNGIKIDKTDKKIALRLSNELIKKLIEINIGANGKINLDNLQYMLDTYERIKDISGLKSVKNEMILKFLALEDPTTIFVESGDMFDYGGDISYNENYPEEFYSNCIKPVKIMVAYASVFFRLYKIFIEKNETEKADKYITKVYSLSDNGFFEKKWRETVESNSITNEKEKLSEAFISYLSTRPDVVYDDEKIKLHHGALANDLYEEMLNYFIKTKNSDEIKKLKLYFRAPSSNDLYSKNMTFMNHDESTSFYIDKLVLSDEMNIKSSLTTNLINHSEITQKSGGEVLNPEMYDLNTNEPITNGIYCDKIFKPKANKKSFFSFKSKPKNIVENETIGHIDLQIRVSNDLSFNPFDQSSLLGITLNQLIDIQKHKRYYVVKPGEETFNKIGQPIQIGNIITAQEYNENFLKEDFLAKTGGDAICEILKTIDLHSKSEVLRKIEDHISGIIWGINEKIAYQTLSEDDYGKKETEIKKEKINLEIDDLIEIMAPKKIPVVEKKFRPLSNKDKAKYEISINDYYRRLIIRNNRLKRLIEIKAPEVILVNEKKMLAEAFLDLTKMTKINFLAKQALIPSLNLNLHILKSHKEFSNEFIMDIIEILKNLSQIYDKADDKNLNIKSNYILKICEIILKFYDEKNDDLSEKLLDIIYELIDPYKEFANNSGILYDMIKSLSDAGTRQQLALGRLWLNLDDNHFYKLVLMFFKKIKFEDAIKFYNKNKNRIFSANFLPDFTEILKANKINIRSKEDYNYLLLSFPDNSEIFQYYLNNSKKI